MAKKLQIDQEADERVSLSDIQGDFVLSPVEKRILLSKSGRIRTKYRKKLENRLISEHFLDKNGDFLPKGRLALAKILDGSSMHHSLEKAIFESWRNENESK